MATKRRTDQSQLDYLWDMFGDLSTSDNPLEADNGDILNKKGVTALVSSMIRGLLKSLRLEEDDDNGDIYNVVSIANNGDTKAVFSIEKEDHLESVSIRMSTEADVANGVSGDVWEPVLDFGMHRGGHIPVSLKDVYLEGGKTKSISSWVADGKIYSQLRLANSDDPTMNVEVIQGGLLIELLLADNSGQVTLEKTSKGLKTSFKWADGKDVRMKNLEWAEYALEPDAERPGTVYFFKDREYILLNGKRYGEIPADVARFESDPIDGNPEQKTLILKKEDSITSKDGDSKTNLIKQDKNGSVVVGDSGSPVNIFGSDPLKYNGSRVAMLDEVNGSFDDVMTELDQMKEDVSNAFKNAEEATNQLVSDEAERVNGVIQTLSANVNRSIAKVISDTETNFRNVNDKLEKAVLFEDVSNSDNPGRKAIILNNHDIILGRRTDGTSVAIAMLSKWDKADFGSGTVPVNLNGSEARPTYNDDKQIALVDDLSDAVIMTDVSDASNPGRKAIVLNNHDIILGCSTDGRQFGIGMVSKWNVVDFGSIQLPINLNGSGERPTYNDTKEIALYDDIALLRAEIETLSAEVESLKASRQ